MAGFLADTPQEAKEFYDVMNEGRFFPAGRTMSNAGIGETLTLANCYVVGSVPDSMNDIFDMARIGAITQKAGGGTGYDFSSLRPSGSPTSNDAVASGPVSFMQVFNSATATILQGSRRGANMGVMSCYHPDIECFIDCKADPDRPENMQYFNLSVMVDDAFMKAVQDDLDIDLHFPVYAEDFSIETDSSKWTHRKTIRARSLWDKIIHRAYENGEPGVLFYDTMNRLNNTRYCETIIGTNPCGEFLSGTLHIPDNPEASRYKGACNLGSLFLPSFLMLEDGNTAYDVDWHRLRRTIYTAVRMLDKVIDKNRYPHEDYENYQKNMRPIGLGITGLADMMALLGIRYGSNESLFFADTLMSLIANEAYIASIDLACKFGPFPYYEKAILHSEFLENQKRSNPYLPKLPGNLYKKVPSLSSIRNYYCSPDAWNELYDSIAKHGLRNARLLSIAPTGTLSLTFGNNCSSGLEPIFMLEQTRKVKIGGQETENEQTISLNNPAWDIYQEGKQKHGGWEYITDDTFITALELSVDEHLDVLQTIAYHVDMSCSKTINIPTEYSFEDTKEVYMKAWERGLKGCTIFRPNEIRPGILTSSENASKAPVSDSATLPRGQVVQVDNDVIGRERHLRTGCGTLHAQAYFDPESGDLLETYASRGSMGGCNSFMIGMSRLVSLAARAGVSVEDITDQLLSVPPCIAYNNRSRDYKDTSKGTSCPSAMGHALLDMYAQIKRDLGITEEPVDINVNAEDSALREKLIEAIEDIDAELLAQNKCPDCGEPIIFEGGCNICKSCGWSKCG